MDTDRQKAMVERPGPVVRAGILVVICGLLYTAYVAVCWGFADYYGEQATQIMVAWSKGKTVTPADWDRAHTAMEQALSLDAKHPAYLHRMGRLYHVGMRPALSSVAVFRERGELAKQYFRDAIHMRRSWPSTWANLALVKRDLGEFDAEMNQVIEKAVTLGPWEPDVHRMIATTGLSYFGVFPANVREMIAENVKRGLLSPTRRAWPRMMAIVNRYPNGLGDEVLSSLGSMLADEKWASHQQLNFLSLAMTLWPKLNSPLRFAIADRLVEVIDASRHRTKLLGRIKATQLGLLACVKLPRNNIYLPYCRMDLG